MQNMAELHSILQGYESSVYDPHVYTSTEEYIKKRDSDVTTVARIGRLLLSTLEKQEESSAESINALSIDLVNAQEQNRKLEQMLALGSTDIAVDLAHKLDELQRENLTLASLNRELYDQLENARENEGESRAIEEKLGETIEEIANLEESLHETQSALQLEKQRRELVEKDLVAAKKSVLLLENKLERRSQSVRMGGSEPSQPEDSASSSSVSSVLSPNAASAPSSLQAVDTTGGTRRSLQTALQSPEFQLQMELRLQAEVLENCNAELILLKGEYNVIYVENQELKTLLAGRSPVSLPVDKDDATLFSGSVTPGEGTLDIRDELSLAANSLPDHEASLVGKTVLGSSLSGLSGPGIEESPSLLPKPPINASSCSSSPSPSVPASIPIPILNMDDIADAFNPTAPLMGWLWKCGGVVHSWKQRYFVLTQSNLCYYKKMKDYPSKKPQGVIPLDVFYTRVLPQEEANQIGRRHAFDVIVPFRTFQLNALNDPDMKMWVRALQNRRRISTHVVQNAPQPVS
jgi:hypothetical protein